MEYVPLIITLSIVLSSMNIKERVKIYSFTVLVGFIGTAMLAVLLASHQSFALILMWASASVLAPGMFLTGTRAVWTAECITVYVVAWLLWFR